MNITKFFRFRTGTLPAVPARSAQIVRFQRKSKPLDPFRPVVRWRVNPATGRLECRWTVIANAPGAACVAASDTTPAPLHEIQRG